jgi:calcineurin-like phosphoesterase
MFDTIKTGVLFRIDIIIVYFRYRLIIIIMNRNKGTGGLGVQQKQFIRLKKEGIGSGR